MNASRKIQVQVCCADALEFGADVLALKYAQDLYGIDAEAYERLYKEGTKPILPKVSDCSLHKSPESIGAEYLLFVGVNPLIRFGYSEIREFGRQVLVALAEKAPYTMHLALTIHGAGYGLDENYAFESELAGLFEAVGSGEFPRSLEKITFVERNFDRANRLSAALKRFVPDGFISTGGQGALDTLEYRAQATLKSARFSTAAKSHVFVAMPFDEEMSDVFHYGIQGAVNAAGLLCERADLSSFTGDVMDRVKQRIANATLVVADLSSANPNVYLEVGYAWGCGVPTVLVANNEKDLKFDVKGQRCIIYKSIKHLEESLSNELRALTA